MNLYLRIGFSVIILTSIAIFGCRNKNSESQQKLTKDELSTYAQKGSELAASTQKVLASNLIGAIEDGGAVNALEFCTVKAIPLTDSMAVELGAHIKRVTDRSRNPENQANDEELNYIKSAKKQLSNQENIDPAVKYTNGKIMAYYPIITNQLCMQCHGNENTQIDAATLQKIKMLYPEDQATGYDVGELRGIWVVEMEKMANK